LLRNQLLIYIIYHHHIIFIVCYFHSIIALTGKMPEVINMFSIIRNSRDLIKYNRNNDLNIFNGLKVLTMIVVLFGHKFLYFVINPITYGMHLEKVIQIIFCIGIILYDIQCCACTRKRIYIQLHTYF